MTVPGKLVKKIQSGMGWLDYDKLQAAATPPCHGVRLTHL